MLWQPASLSDTIPGVSNSYNDATTVLPENKKLTTVLICVVVRIESERQRLLFERTVESILGLDVPDGVQASVLVIDNASLFSVQDFIATKTAASIEVVRRTANNLGAARTQGMRVALQKGCEWIAYVDSDIELPIEWLKILTHELRSSAMKDAVGIAAVNRPPHEGEFARSLDFFLGFEHTHLGSPQVIQLQSTAHEAVTKRKVDHLATCAVLIHTKALEHAGGFKSDFSRVCEDLEMSYRLRRNGSLWMLSGPVVLHRQDRNWQAWAKRMFRYGWGQIEVARHHQEHLKTRKALPLLAAFWGLVALALLIFGVSAPFKITLVGYLGFMLAPILLRGIGEGKMDVAFSACWIAVVTHIAYAAGMISGLLRISRNPVVTQPGDGG